MRARSAIALCRARGSATAVATGVTSPAATRFTDSSVTAANGPAAIKGGVADVTGLAVGDMPR
jgi:hypothetical protein